MDTVVFRWFFLLNMIRLNLPFLYKLLYINNIYRFLYKFDTVLNQFLETETSNRTLMGLEKPRFQPMPPFIFPLQSF